MSDKKLEKFLKQNRPLAPKVSLDGERLWDAIEEGTRPTVANGRDQRSTRLVFSRRVGLSVGAIAACLVVFALFQAPGVSNEREELEAVAIIEEAFGADFVGDMEIGEDYVALGY